jgi:hypothetical protein
MNIRTTLSALVAASFGGLAVASVVVDGSLDKAYGPALAIQDSQTGFGDSDLGLIDFCNGSELNNAHAFVDVENGYLRLFFGGNLESNFNKLEVFIDYRDGGQNRLRGDNPDVDFNGLNRMGDDGTGNGLTFDKGFEADFYVTMTGGGDPYAIFSNTAQILTEGGGVGEFIGSGGAGENLLIGTNGTLVAINNSNTAGVPFGFKAGDGSGVTTGIEISIPLDLLEGYDGRDIKVSAFINGGGHDFLSNQILGGIGGGQNFGEPRNILFDFVPGLQYFVVPGAAPSNCPADLDGNGAVDPADLALLLGAWGTAGGDIDGNGTTDPADLALLLGSWGGCP